MSDYISANQASKELSLTRSRVSQLIKEKKLIALRMGRSTFISREELEAFKKSRIKE